LESRQKKWVRAASAGFLMAIPLLAILAVSGVFIFWGLGQNTLGNDALGSEFIVLAENPPHAERRFYGLIASAPALLFWLYSMWRLFRMFLDFRTDSMIADNTIKHLRAFSLFSFIAVITGFLLSGVMRWAAGVFDDAPLWTHLGFSTTHASVLFTSAIIYVASFIVEEGYAYKREAAEYI